jgi:cytochrome oxidase Cu insertion factor (SCO1/SenC/PrrC family)
MKKSNPKTTMIIMLLVCLTPVIASYLAYYVFKPTAKNNHGVLISPQKDIPVISTIKMESTINSANNLQELKGKWLLVIAGSAECNEECAKRLFIIRQLRNSQGKEANRIVPVWLIMDNKDIDPTITRAYNDYLAAVKFIRVDEKSKTDIEKLLNISQKDKYTDNIYLIDPNQHLMMYYTKEHEPKGMIKDLSKLLKWSRIG